MSVTRVSQLIENCAQALPGIAQPGTGPAAFAFMQLRGLHAMCQLSLIPPDHDLDSQLSEDAPDVRQEPCVGHQGIQNWSGGKFVCYNRGEYPYIEWTVSSRHVLALMGGPANGNIDDVYQWWAARYS